MENLPKIVKISPKSAVTFAEVLVAMAIFLTAVAPLMGWNAGLLRTNRILTRIETEALLFENLLTHLWAQPAAAYEGKSGEYDYVFTPDGDAYKLLPADSLTSGFQSKTQEAEGLRFTLTVSDAVLKEGEKTETLKEIRCTLYGESAVHKGSTLLSPRGKSDGAW